jgi:outer membrane receptor protein involved in Fe transport
MRRVTWGVTVFLLVGISITSSIAAFSQAVNATLVGTVTDASGAVVSGAHVVIKEKSTGITHTVATNESGNYVVANLPPGSYDVTSQMQGFKSATRSAVAIEVNSTVRVDFSLKPGAEGETITVTEMAPILETDRADVGTKIEMKQVEELPMGGPNRNFQMLLGSVPGAVRPHRDHSEFFNSQDTLSSEVNGQSREFNQLMIEGVNDDERTGLLQIYVPPAEAIETVDVTTSNYAAEFGRAGGAVTNVALKSGTNDFHGSAYEINRLSALAARSYFNRPPNALARSTYNYYGGTIGGPIIKNKTFFFFDLLRIDDHRGQFNRLTVPTDGFRVGDFSAAGVNIYNPYTGNLDGTGRTQFQCDASGNPLIPNAQGIQATGTPCNKIPAQLISPIANKLIALVPHANLSGLTNNYTHNTLFTKANTAFDVKIDHNLRKNDRLAFRFSRAVQTAYQQPIFGLAGGPANGAFEGTGTQHQQSGALNETHIFSPTLVAEVRAGISHYRNVAHNADYGSKASSDIGIPGVNLDAFTSGLVSMDIGGFSSPLVGYSGSFPWDRGETNIDLVNNWTKIHGNHTFKWGADVRRLRDDLVQAQTFGPRGRFSFGTGPTALNSGGKSSPTNLANNFATFLLDQATDVGRDISLISGSWRETEAFFFGQDTWHATQNLTVDAGMRWELYLPATPHHAGGYSNYDPTQNVLVVAGVGGNPLNMGRTTYYHYFAPRLGFAYRLNEGTVLRGGFGMSYEPFTNNNYGFNNFPVRQNNEYPNPNGFAPACLVQTSPCPAGSLATLENGFPSPAPFVTPTNGIIPAKLGDTDYVVDKHFEQPYVEAWNLAIQRSLWKNFVLDVAYVGNHGVKIPVQYDLNAALAPSWCTAAQIAGNLLGCGGKTTTSLQNSNCVQGQSTRPLCNLFGRSGATNFLYKRTTSNFNSLQVKLNHRWSAGFLMTVAYTWAKALAYRSDMGNDGGGPDNYIDFQRNYSVESRNRTHTFVSTFVYELPFGKGKRFAASGPASWIVGGWGLSGVLTRMSGLPMHFTDNGNALAANGSTQYPDLITAFHVLGGIDANAWFDPNSFAQHVIPAGCATADCALGNMKRYEFTGPGFFNLDAGVFRHFPIGERVGLELRAESFSVTNTPQFSLPNTSRTSPDFGHIIGVDGGNRSVQFAAKVTF